MAVTLTTSGSVNTTIDNYTLSILSNTSSVQLGTVSLKLVVPGGCTIKNVNAGTSSISGLQFLQKDENLNVSLTSVSNWVVNTNDVILSITASGMSTGSFTLNTDEDWYCEIASSSAEPFTDFAIKMPSLASPYASVSTTLYVDGNLLVTGRITGEEFHTEFVSASIIYQSGSTQFGNSSDDTHIFTGSLRVSGSITSSLLGTSSWAINARTSSNIFPAITNNTSTYVLTATGNGTINGNSNLTFDGSDLTLGSFTGIVLPSNGYVKGPQSTILLGGNATYNVSIPNDFVTATASFGSPSSTRIQLLTNVESIPGGYDSGSIFFKTPSGSGMTYTNEGRLGIGTTIPSASLHVQGNFQISTGSLYTYGQNTDIDSGSIRTVMSVSTGSYRAAFFDYVLNKSTNARAGTVFSVWNGASVEWNDVSTNDIGNTAEINLSVGLSGANVILYASSSTNDWSVKALARML